MSLFIDFDVSLPKPESFFRTIFGSAAFAVTKRWLFLLFVTAKAALPKIVLKKLSGLGSETSKSINKLIGSTKWLWITIPMNATHSLFSHYKLLGKILLKVVLFIILDSRSSEKRCSDSVILHGLNKWNTKGWLKRWLNGLQKLYLVYRR